MVLGIATLPCPAFGNDDAVVGLIEVPGIVGVAPGTATDEAVALAIVHLAGETIGIRSVVAVEVAVVMRIAIDHVVVGTELTIVGRAVARVGEIMPEAQLESRIEIVGEDTALDAIVRALELDAIVGSMGDVQAKKHPVVARDEDATIAHALFAKLLLEVEHRHLVLITADGDGSLGGARLGKAHSEFVRRIAPGEMISAATANDMVARGGLVDRLLQIHPRLPERAIARRVVAIGSNVIGVQRFGEWTGGDGYSLHYVSAVLRIACHFAFGVVELHREIIDIDIRCGAKHAELDIGDRIQSRPLAIGSEGRRGTGDGELAEFGPCCTSVERITHGDGLVRTARTIGEADLLRLAEQGRDEVAVGAVEFHRGIPVGSIGSHSAYRPRPSGQRHFGNTAVGTRETAEILLEIF